MKGAAEDRAGRAVAGRAKIRVESESTPFHTIDEVRDRTIEMNVSRSAVGPYLALQSNGCASAADRKALHGEARRLAIEIAGEMPIDVIADGAWQREFRTLGADDLAARVDRDL